MLIYKKKNNGGFGFNINSIQYSFLFGLFTGLILSVVIYKLTKKECKGELDELEVSK